MINLFVPGRCPPAGEGGNQGSLCPQLRILSTLADSQTSSHWCRRSRGQRSGISAAQRVSLLRREYNETHYDGHRIALAVKHISSRCIFWVQIWCNTHAKMFITASVACGKYSVFQTWLMNLFRPASANIWWFRLSFLSAMTRHQRAAKLAASFSWFEMTQRHVMSCRFCKLLCTCLSELDKS